MACNSLQSYETPLFLVHTLSFSSLAACINEGATLCSLSFFSFSKNQICQNKQINYRSRLDLRGTTYLEDCCICCLY